MTVSNSHFFSFYLESIPIRLSFISTISLTLLLGRSPLTSTLLNFMVKVLVLLLLDLYVSTEKADHSYSFKQIPQFLKHYNLLFFVLFYHLLSVCLLVLTHHQSTSFNPEAQILSLLSSHTKFLGEVAILMALC